MTTFLIAFLFFAIVVAGMAVGVIFSNKPIKGSCGGLSNIGLDGDCEICGGNLDKCEESNKEQKNATDLAYDATKR
ncbi:(Na+)-NQR maturation NqrM [Ketobacter alkanivorans]|uniref:ApbE family protein n=1 Tax=Ketobacter alkanivorans TaxID=1917421 RepID=A0A2K9LUS5_9GAMM|nr:(Na+)-NQR maturation NqrM [Ketobacter alkanivorans]AUM14594.1 ApbE family protein [Ketobacter alkanivorans]MCP5013936.1 (Na+)-NQR maturation NqrM [Ketobacter sp.]